MSRARLVVIVLILVAIVLLLLTRSVLYVVNEREMAVVLEFGRPVASRTEPGVYFKVPFIQEVRTLPKTLQFWSSAADDRLVDLPTADGKKIEVDVWAAWRITEPQQFVEVLRNVDNGGLRVQQYVRAVARDKVTSYKLSEVIRSTDRKLTFSLQLADLIEVGEEQQDDIAALEEQIAPGVNERILVGRKKLVEEIKAEVQRRLADKDAARGIELVDLGISRIDFVPSVREAAFSRQIALMESIAARYTNEGERRRQEILNRTEAEVKRIEGEGMQEASITRGRVDAEITTAYAQAIDQTGDFYFFYRTLEAYTTALQGKTRLILTTDSEMFRMLKEIGEAPSPPSETATADAAPPVSP